MTNNKLPALLMREQIPFLAKMLSQPLESDDIPKGKRRAALRPDWELIENENEQRLEAVLSRLFSHRDIACCLGAEFWVYCTSLDDVAEAKKQLAAYGYKNIGTFIPKVGHPEDDKKSIPDPDPRHAFAIRVSPSESLIFGEHANKWLELHKHLIDVVREYITYTYCHNTDARFTFQTREPALILYTGLLYHYAEMKKQAEKQNKEMPEMIIKIKQSHLCINSYVVCLDWVLDCPTPERKR